MIVKKLHHGVMSHNENLAESEAQIDLNNKIAPSEQVETVETLRAELLRAQEKFADWKAKTKVGVDRLRDQVVQLTEELANCKHQKRSDAAACSALDDVLALWFHNSSSTLIDHAMVSCDATVAASEATFKGGIAAVQANFDKYRKRAEQSIKLSASQQESLVEETRELRSALDRAIEELRAKDNAIEQRNLAVSSLEKQLDAAYFSVESLRAEAQERQLQALSMMDGCDIATGSPSTSGPLVPLSEVEVELERVRIEFGEREAVMHQVHREEMERMLQSHELETQQLIDDLNERHRSEVARLTVQLEQSCTASGRRPQDDDEAYRSLMEERDQLGAAVREKEALIATLKRELAALPSVSASHPGGQSAGSKGSGSADAATKRVHELERQVASLTDQLWAANNAMLESKALKREMASSNRHSVASSRDAAPQVSTYLKSIIVKLLCEKNDEVKANLVPVLTTLLQLDTDELRAIFSSNPGWMKS